MKLVDYLKKEGITHERFAEMVGVSRAYITTIISGRRTPSPALIKKVQKITNNKVGLDDLFSPKAPTRYKGRVD